MAQSEKNKSACGASNDKMRADNKKRGCGNDAKRRKKQIAITKNDIVIIGLINRFGFLTVKEISKITNRLEKVVYQRLKLLCDGGFLQHKAIFWGQHGAYWPTYKGQAACRSLLTPIKAPRVATYAHELKVVEVYMALKERYGEKLSWLTARELMSDKIASAADFKQAFKALRSRTPDGIAIYEGRKFAVEVELSLKKNARLRQIIGSYASAINGGLYDLVLYYTDQPGIADKLKAAIAGVGGVAGAKFRVGKI
jgi:hypothetical protein